MLLVIAAGISKALESREPRQGEVSAIVHMVAAELACPKVRISSVAPGPPSRRVNFTAFVSPSSDGLTYAWSVSKGKIVSQRGAMIFVEAPPGRITASVKVGGLAASCNGVATEAVDML
jgi:hypothetical protein